MQTNYLKEFKNITVPTSILWGDKDVFALSKDQDVLKDNQKFKTCDLHWYRTRLHWEEPKRFAQELTTFINESMNVSAVANR